MTKKEELQKIWNSATTPKVADLEGAYRVKMLSGFFQFLNTLGDIKVFRSNVGYNVLGKDSVWGYFWLENAPGKLIINYNRGINSNRMVRRIRDHIRYVAEHKYYIGKFNMVLGNKLRFLGWFTLTKIQND